MIQKLFSIDESHSKCNANRNNQMETRKSFEKKYFIVKFEHTAPWHYNEKATKYKHSHYIYCTCTKTNSENWLNPLYFWWTKKIIQCTNDTVCQLFLKLFSESWLESWNSEKSKRWFSHIPVPMQQVLFVIWMQTNALQIWMENSSISMDSCAWHCKFSI